MTKSDAKRSEILDRLADYVLAEGLSASSIRALAEAAGTSDRMLLYYFKDKAEIMAATLERLTARLTDILNAARADAPLPFETLRTDLLEAALSDALWPYLRLWLEISSLAARGDPLYRAVGEKIGHGFLAWCGGQLASRGKAREKEAVRLLMLIEGAVLLKAVGLDDACRDAF